MLKKRTNVLYCVEFQKYQTFTSFDDLKNTVSLFEKTYELTKSMKAVLNTIKLHAKNYIGVCWLYREELAKKSGYSKASVDRAVKELKEIGLLTVVPQIHTKRGGKTHNVYIINNLVDNVDNPVDDGAYEESNDGAYEESNEESLEPVEQPSKPCGTSVSETEAESYKNAHSNSNNNPDKNPNTEDIKDFDNIDNPFHQTQSDTEEENKFLLRYVPTEFIEIMKPYYSNDPKIILARWKSTCIAAKNWCNSIHNASWETIRSAWKDSVLMYKTGQLRNNTEEGIAGFYYKHLSGKLVDDYAL